MRPKNRKRKPKRKDYEKIGIRPIPTCWVEGEDPKHNTWAEKKGITEQDAKYLAEIERVRRALDIQQLFKEQFVRGGVKVDDQMTACLESIRRHMPHMSYVDQDKEAKRPYGKVTLGREGPNIFDHYFMVNHSLDYVILTYLSENMTEEEMETFTEVILNEKIQVSNISNLQTRTEDQQELILNSARYLETAIGVDPEGNSSDLTSKSVQKALSIVSVARPDSVIRRITQLHEKYKDSNWLPLLYAGLAGATQNPIVRPFEDEEMKFLTLFIRTAFPDGLPEHAVDPLKSFVKKVRREKDDPDKYYSRLRKILAMGGPKNLTNLEIFGDFEADETFLEKLGEGAWGQAYKVYSQSLDSLMAMKIIAPKDISRFEAVIMNELEHPNIVKIKYAGDKLVRQAGKKRYAILMDYVDGKSLAEIMDDNPEGLPEKEALRYGSQICSAIIYLRRKGFVHRDIHTRNIVIDSSNNAVLIDFGTALYKNLNFPLDGNRRYEGPTDLFSWGLTFYKIVSGEHLLNEGEGTTERADLIAERRVDIWKEDGSLLDGYREKIDARIPKELRTPLLLALERPYKHESEDTYSKVQRHLDMITIDPEKKKMMEKVVGQELSDDKYVQILSAAYHEER